VKLYELSNELWAVTPFRALLHVHEMGGVPSCPYGGSVPPVPDSTCGVVLVMSAPARWVMVNNTNPSPPQKKAWARIWHLMIDKSLR
jgi:hypothetical protein